MNGTNKKNSVGSPLIVQLMNSEFRKKIEYMYYVFLGICTIEGTPSLLASLIYMDSSITRKTISAIAKTKPVFQMISSII